MTNVDRATKKTKAARAGDAVDKLETIESLRAVARKEIERAMLKVQREIAVLQTTAEADEKVMHSVARNLCKAWGLLDCQRLEIGVLESRFDKTAPAVTQ